MGAYVRGRKGHAKTKATRRETQTPPTADTVLLRHAKNPKTFSNLYEWSSTQRKWSKDSEQQKEFEERMTESEDSAISFENYWGTQTMPWMRCRMPSWRLTGSQEMTTTSTLEEIRQQPALTSFYRRPGVSIVTMPRRVQCSTGTPASLPTRISGERAYLRMLVFGDDPQVNFASVGHGQYDGNP